MVGSSQQRKNATNSGKAFVSLLLFLTLLTSCGGGSNSTAPLDLPLATDTDTDETTEVVESVVWQEATPESVGMDSGLLEQTFDQAFVDGSYTQAALVIKDDKLSKI